MKAEKIKAKTFSFIDYTIKTMISVLFKIGKRA